MKFKLIICSVILFVSSGYSQNNVNVKFKTNGEKIHYYNLPEIYYSTPHTSYDIEFKDENGVKFNFGMGNIYAIPATDYIRGFKIGEGNFKIEVSRVSSEKSKTVKVLKSTTHNKKGSDGNMIEYNLQSYNFLYNQTYKITILDALNNNEVVYDEILDFVGIADFPKDFDGRLGFSNNMMLDTSLIGYMGRNRDDFEPKADKATTVNCFKNDIKDKLNSLIAFKRFQYVFTYNNYKIKDSNFELLDSATTYLKEGLSLFNDQKGSGVYLNAHAENVYHKMNNAHRLFIIYSEDKYVDMISNEFKTEYKYAVRLNLFITKVLSSRYDDAIELYNLTEKEYKAKQIEIANSGNMVPSFKLRPDEKCYLMMQKFSEIIERERMLYEKHKVDYKFYN